MRAIAKFLARNKGFITFMPCTPELSGMPITTACASPPRAGTGETRAFMQPIACPCATHSITCKVIA